MSRPYYGTYTTSYEDGRVTYAVQRLILASALVFAVQLLLEVPFGPSVPYGPPGGFVSSWLSFHSRGPLFAYLWQPFTYQFIHGGLSHLFFNALILYVFGPEVERALGTRKFFGFYLGCGAVGVLLSLARPEIVSGASGAIMAVLVAHAVVNPEREVFIFPFAVPLNVRAVVMLVIVLNIVNALLGSGTSVLTHFGGMGAGYAYMKLEPRLRHLGLGQWRARRARRAARPKPKTDRKLEDVGEAVDNIFRFEDKKRRGK